jgi:DNA-binding MarR family transcriptional regulator
MPAGGGGPALAAAVVTADELDPVIHAPARLRMVVTLATLSGDDDLSFTRLGDIIALTPGNLITHLRKLQDAGYVETHKSGNGTAGRTGVKLTHAGRAALDRYRAALHELLDAPDNRQLHAPG